MTKIIQYKWEIFKVDSNIIDDGYENLWNWIQVPKTLSQNFLLKRHTHCMKDTLEKIFGTV